MKRRKKQKMKNWKKCESLTMVQKSKWWKINKAEKDGFLECWQVSDDDEDEQWIQCESCLGWIHQSCHGHPGLTCDQLQGFVFLCKTCDIEELVTH